MQGAGSAEAFADKQGAERERGGQGPGHQQGHDVRVGQRQLPAVPGGGAQLRRPAGVGGIHLELCEHGLGDAAGQRRLAGRMPATAAPATARSLQRCSRSPHTSIRGAGTMPASVITVAGRGPPDRAYCLQKRGVR